MGPKPHPKNAFGLSRDQPDNGLVAVVSHGAQTVVVQAFEKVQYVCLDSPVCVHPAAHFGDVAPGKWASAHGSSTSCMGHSKTCCVAISGTFPLNSRPMHRAAVNETTSESALVHSGVRRQSNVSRNKFHGVAFPRMRQS